MSVKMKRLTAKDILRVRSLGRVAPSDLDALVAGLAAPVGVDYLFLVAPNDRNATVTEPQLVEKREREGSIVWVYETDESLATDWASGQLGSLAIAQSDYAEIEYQGFGAYRSPTPRDTAGAKPDWMRARANFGADFRSTRQLMKSLELNTVCEEAGCPNISECWADRTATFMILGERCTRACGFCLVDTRKPQVLDQDEPRRVADAVSSLGLEHAVITSVARDDLVDGGAGGFVATINAVRAKNPHTSVEVLIPDCKGDPTSLATLFSARPDVLNHNLETVLRLQHEARSLASYARSLAVLARARFAGLRTKSGIIVGLGETMAEVKGAVADLRAVGVEILTIGQYLQPSARHLRVARWWTPEEFSEIGAYAESLGFSHVESGPLVRSSYHAKRAVTKIEVSAVL